MTDGQKANVRRVMGTPFGRLTPKQLVDTIVTLKDATDEELDELGLGGLRDIDA